MKKSKTKVKDTAQDQPIRPGSTVYQLLDLIAREIAKDVLSQRADDAGLKSDSRSAASK